MLLKLTRTRLKTGFEIVLPLKSTTIVGSQLTPAHLKECEKQRNLWQKRLNGLKKLKLGLETSGRPHAPSKVIVEVTGKISMILPLGCP